MAQMQANYDRIIEYSLFPWVRELHLETLPMSDAGAQHARDIIARSGAQDAVEAEIDREFSAALAVLEASDLTDSGREGLAALAHRAVRRSY